MKNANNNIKEENIEEIEKKYTLFVGTRGGPSSANEAKQFGSDTTIKRK